MKIVFTYFFRSRESGLVKIGKTSCPMTRFKTLGGSSRLQCIKLIDHDCEKRLHEKFAEHRIVGEWFDLPADVTNGLKVIDPSTFPEVPIFNVVRISDEAHDRLRALKRSLKPGMRSIGEIASEIIKSADIDGMSKADKKRTSRKEAK